MTQTANEPLLTDVFALVKHVSKTPVFQFGIPIEGRERRSRRRRQQTEVLLNNLKKRLRRN